MSSSRVRRTSAWSACPCKNDACAMLKAGGAKIETRCLVAHDKICGNESAYYPPLAKNVKAIPAVASEHTYKGAALRDSWQEQWPALGLASAPSRSADHSQPLAIPARRAARISQDPRLRVGWYGKWTFPEETPMMPSLRAAAALILCAGLARLPTTASRGKRPTLPRPSRGSAEAARRSGGSLSGRQGQAAGRDMVPQGGPCKATDAQIGNGLTYQEIRRRL